MKRYMIGRAETNDIVLQEPSVSREHAELVKVSRSTFLLRDLGSTYGTSARQGSDWHLVTAENVDYLTPIRIGEIETTVAKLLRDLDPLAVYMEQRADPPWVRSNPRLSAEERAHHPETMMQGWGPGGSPAPLFASTPSTAQIAVLPQSRRFLYLAFMGGVTMAVLVATAVMFLSGVL